jgi:hypothetical protein
MSVEVLADRQLLGQTDMNAVQRGVSPLDRYDASLSVTRYFLPEPAVLDELVEALYSLIIDAPNSQAESTCFYTATE